jgi:hypothetical protein
MPKEIIFYGEPGQKVTVRPKPNTIPGRILRSATNLKHTQGAVYIDGVWVDPAPPPVDPPPVDPPPPPTDDFPVFLSRPRVDRVDINGGTDVEITNKSIVGGGVAITVRNATRVWIHHNDWADCVGGVYVSQCTDVVTEHNRGRNVGDGTIGAGHSNMVQYAETTGGSIESNRFFGGRTEDMISTWHSGGHGLGKELLIQDNHIQNLVSDIPGVRAYTSGSGTGIIISDGKGSSKNGWVIVRRNTLLTPGQVGIQHIDGPGLQVYENIIYGQKHPQSNNPMTTWEGTPRGVNHHNRYYWFGKDGGLVQPWFAGGINPQIVASNNLQDASIDPISLRVEL